MCFNSIPEVSEGAEKSTRTYRCQAVGECDFSQLMFVLICHTYVWCGDVLFDTWVTCISKQEYSRTSVAWCFPFSLCQYMIHISSIVPYIGDRREARESALMAAEDEASRSVQQAIA